jgi:peptide/nickel transport system permease protein
MSELIMEEPVPQSRALRILSRIATNFWLRRILKMFIVTWIVVTIIFFVIRLMPGSPMDVMVQDLMITRGLAYDEALGQAAQLMGINLNEPIMTQYLNYMGNLLKGDMGKSYRNTTTTVVYMIGQRLPWTLFSVGISLMISFVIGVGLGMIIAYRRNTWLDHLLTSISAVLDAIPNYLIAILVFVLLGVILKWVPIMNMRGSVSPGIEAGFTWEFISDIFSHLAVPGLVYVLSTVGSWMLRMKSNTLSTLGEDYVTVARARGLPDSRIITAYVGRNASLPVVTNLAISLGVLMGGSLLIETIFTYQGIGLLLWQSVNARDYPLMQGVFIVTTIAIIVANFLADILYGWLDPRTRIPGGNK